jgi:CheY-like chemotaxis protein
MSENTISILSVEDDPLQAEWIRATIERHIPNSDIRQLKTEHEFVAEFEAIALRPPRVILLDAMLRWTDPVRDMPIMPAEVQKGGLAQAGLRCRQRLSADSRTSAIPVILYSVLQGNPSRPETLQFMPEDVTHVQKNADPVEMIGKIKLALHQERRR